MDAPPANAEPAPPGHGDARPPEPPLLPLPEEDLAHLEQAVLLGRRGWGRVHPNPMVGCVLVRDGRVLAEAWHEEFGGPHAEVLALERVGGDPAGATAYVSLEPCRHRGKTPACTDALLRAGVARVVYAVADPHPEAGGGGAALRSAGVRVDGPVWPAAAARRENPAFVHSARVDTPFVALKLALTLDGMIAEAPGRRTQISGPEAAGVVHRLRAGFDAVMVGGRTARVDDPRLTVREGGVTPRVAPARIVLDPEGEMPEDGALTREREGRLVVFVGDDADEGRLERLERAGAQVHPVPRAPGGLDLGAVLRVASGVGIRSILCEGGGHLASALLTGGHVGRLYVLHAPLAFGDGAVPGLPGPFRPDAWRGWLPAFDPVRVGRDVLTTWDREG